LLVYDRGDGAWIGGADEDVAGVKICVPET
jgi:hypothetical protein